MERATSDSRQHIVELSSDNAKARGRKSWE